MYLTMSVVSTPFCIKSDLWSLIFYCRKKKSLFFQFICSDVENDANFVLCIRMLYNDLNTKTQSFPSILAIFQTTLKKCLNLMMFSISVG